MDFFQAVKIRRSIRTFQQKEIEEEKLEKILETANAAPSAGNLQAYEIVVIRKPETKRILVDAAWGQTFIAEAPVVLVFFTHPARSARKYRSRGEKLYSIQDATIAVSYAQLAATALGLSSCWVGAFSEEPVIKALGYGQNLYPVAILPIGYAGETPQATPRRSLSEIVHLEKL